MRVCFIANASEIHTRNWVADLRERGHEVAVVSFQRGDLVGATLFHLATRLPRSRVKYVVNVPRVRRIVSSWAPDVVVGYYASGHGLLAVTAGRRPVVVATSGDDVMITPWRSWAARRVTAWILGRADMVSAWGAAMRDSVLRLGVPAHRIFTLPRGIDLARCGEPAASRLRSRGRIAAARHLEPEYQTSVVLHALAIMRRERTDATLTVAGDGSGRRALEELAISLGVSRAVAFLGVVPQAELFRQFQSAELYVTASFSEGTSNALLEAMACGAFPVVPDIPQNREWVTHGENGFLYPHDDAGALARAALHALADTALLERARVRNRAIVTERADWRRNMAQYERLLTDVVRGRRRATGSGATG